jgi:hypothetical protein
LTVQQPWAWAIVHGGKDVENRTQAWFAVGPTKPVVHLVVENPRPLAEPIPAKGRLGLWTPDAELLAAIREQVRA